MVIRITGKRMYLGRAVDHEGKVLDMLFRRRRDTQAALRLMRSCSRNRTSHRSCWSPKSWAPKARLSSNCASPALTIEASERTIAPKTGVDHLLRDAPREADRPVGHGRGWGTPMEMTSAA
jgi:transposase-like protein